MPEKHYKVDFDFLGKDSVPFKKTFEISKEAYDLLEDITSGKKSYEEIFDIDAGDVNNFIKKTLPCASAKLFRTALGTKTATEVLQKQKIPADASIAEKIKYFHDANFEISTLLNHQKDISKNYKEQEQKALDRVKDLDSRKAETEKKAKEDLKKLQKQIKAAKAVLEGKSLEEKLAKLEERKEKIAARISKAEDRVAIAQEKADFKAKSKSVALATALNSYFSPRIIVSWCKHNNVPIDKIYSKAQQKRFSWAMNTPEDYYIKYPNVSSN